MVITKSEDDACMHPIYFIIFAAMEKEMEEYVIEQAHRCLCCGTDMSYGRPDRKFCSKNCKDRYNNQRRTKSTAMKHKVEHILNCNYRILNELMRKGVDVIPLSDIVALGFNPDFLTHMVSRSHGRTIVACYDITYKITESRVFNIQRMSLSLPHKNQEK